MAEIATNLAQCTLAVVMGTAGYGEHTKAPLSTFDELQFIKCNKADYSCYFVRMCERFLEPVRKCRKAHQRHLSTTTLLLAPHSCSAHRAWTVGKRIPMGLVDDIVDALTRAAEMGQRLERLQPPILSDLHSFPLADGTIVSCGASPYLACNACTSSWWSKLSRSASAACRLDGSCFS